MDYKRKQARRKYAHVYRSEESLYSLQAVDRRGETNDDASGGHIVGRMGAHFGLEQGRNFSGARVSSIFANGHPLRQPPVQSVRLFI